MNNRLTEIAFILDRSGSMNRVADSAIEGFNHFLREQQNAPCDARITLVLFDDEYLVPFRSIPVAEAVALNRETYEPRNCTALLDAIGQTIDELGKRLAEIPESARPGKVIVAILTDGLENASQKYTWRDISDRIRHQTDKYQWDFLFLGANQDAIASAAQLNIAAANAANIASDGIGLSAGNAGVARKVKSMRAFAAKMMTAEDIHDLAAPMDNLVAEEDTRRRGGGK